MSLDLNLVQILQETIDDCKLTQTISNKDIVKLLKMNLILKASDDAYQAWHKGFDKMTTMRIK